MDTVLTDTSSRISEFLNSSASEYAYLFPLRNEIPKIAHNIFDDFFNDPNEDMIKFVLGEMFKLDNLGWTCKVLLNIDLFPYQMSALRTIWKTAYPLFVGSRGCGKSFLLAIYVLLKAILDQGSRIVIVGAGFRQARLVFDYINDIFHNSPVLQAMIGGVANGPKYNMDALRFRVGKSTIVAIPLGDGSKIRGYRANIVVADEFASIPKEVFDIVVRGFAATSKSPVENARQLAIQHKLRQMGMSDEQIQNVFKTEISYNQVIYSGTAYYSFNHFAELYDLWKRIILSKGDKEALSEFFGSPDSIPEGFNWRDCAIIRIPYTQIQKGILDEKLIANAQVALPKNVFLMEYGATFVSDSDGVFPRSLIEACTPTPSKPIQTQDGPVIFTPKMRGDKGRKYVLCIDPAAEVNNFAAVILERWAHHARVVYCWTINRKEFLRRKKSDPELKYMDYYQYCSQKIHQLTSLFKVERIEMDSQGGGRSIAEHLRNKDLLKEGQRPIYEIIDLEDPKHTDGFSDGPHVLNLVKPNNEWNEESNRILHKVLEVKSLLFPAFNPILLEAAYRIEQKHKLTFDTYEDCVDNIEALKNEITSIKMTLTKTGKPTYSVASGPSSTAAFTDSQKDRYSALLMGVRYIFDELENMINSLPYDDVQNNLMLGQADATQGHYYGPGVGAMASHWISDGGGALKGGKPID